MLMPCKEGVSWVKVWGAVRWQENFALGELLLTICFQRLGLIRISKDTFKCNGILPDRAMSEVLELFILLVAILGS